MTDTGGIGPSPAARHKEIYDDDEIDLRVYVRAIWRYRIVIMAGTVLCAALAFVWGLLTPRTYQAEVALAVSQSKLAEQAGQGATTANFRPFVESHALAAKVIQELGLGESPYRLSPTTFFGSVVTIEEVRNSTIFQLRARIGDPVLVARLVNRVAELAVETSRRVSQQEAVRSRDDIKLQRDEAQSRMGQSEAQLRAFRESSQIELLRKDVDALLGQRGQLLTLMVGIETEKARLAKAEEELSARQRIDTVKRTIDSEPALMESARKSTNQSTDLLGLELRNEFVNPVYQALDQQIATSRTNLAALERQKTQLVDVRKLDAGQLKQLTQLYEKEGELSHLEMERDLARKVYTEVATSYETARLQVAGRSAQLQIIEPALPADRPESRRVARNTLIALVVGLMLSAMGALVHNALLATRA